MARPWWTFEQELSAYLQELKDGNRAEITLDEYAYAIRACAKALRDAKLPYNPRMIGRKEIDYLRNEVFTTSNEYAEIMVKRLLLFCRWAGNTKIAKVKIGFGLSQSRKVRWLTDDEARAFRECALSPTEKMLVHCELDLGMRKCEVRRLTTKSFAKGRVNTVMIHGKGRNGENTVPSIGTRIPRESCGNTRRIGMSSSARPRRRKQRRRRPTLC